MSTLPTLEAKYHRTKLSSNGKEVKMRPYTTGEQKQVMLVRETAKNDNDLYKTIIELVRNCVSYVDGTPVDATELFQVDFEKLFYDLRAISDGEDLPFTMKYTNDAGIECECNQTINTQTDLVITGTNWEKLIKITDVIAIKFRQVTMRDILSISNYDSLSDTEKVFTLMGNCVQHIIDGETIIKDYTQDDLKVFIESIPSNIFKKEIVTFFSETPKLVCTKKFICEGKDEPVTVTAEEVRSFLS